MDTEQILNMQGVAENTTDEGVTWKSCCFRSDKAFVQYFTSNALIASVMFFCFFQLITKPGCNDQSSYLSLLGLVLGVVLPQPSMKISELPARESL